MLLDLSNTACPINFVRTKIKLDEMSSGEILEVILDEGEAIESVSKSVVEEGHKVLSKEDKGDATWLLKVEVG